MLPLTNTREEVIMAHKNDYTCIVYFPGEQPKKWSYVHNLWGFSQFLNQSHSTWLYFNVYERRTGKYIKRFYRTNIVPPFLALIFLVGINTLNSTFNFSPSFSFFFTFINDFNNTATIWIPQFRYIGGLFA